MKALLQLEKLPEGRIVLELPQRFWYGVRGARPALLTRRVLGLGEAYLRQQALDLAETFSDLAWIVGRKIVERMRQQRLHCQVDSKFHVAELTCSST